MTKVDSVKKYLTGDNELRLEYMKKWQNKVKDLYRYRQINQEREFEIEALEKRDVFRSSFDKLNDDEEGTIVSRLLNKCPPNIKCQVRKKLKEFRKEYGVACFSEVSPFDKGAKYMWDNYAGESEGICIQYSILDIIDKEFYILPVIYVDRVNCCDFYEKKDFIAELSYVMKYRCGNDKDSIQRNWQNEHEWRHIDRIDNERGNYSGIYLEPTKIYIGKRLKEVYKNKIENMFPNIEIVSMSLFF